jgi:hypothetical protein
VKSWQVEDFWRQLKKKKNSGKKVFPYFGFTEAPFQQITEVNNK